MKKIKPTDWNCVICGADCWGGVCGLIKKQLYCLKCYGRYRKLPPEATGLKSRRVSGILVI